MVVSRSSKKLIFSTLTRSKFYISARFLPWKYSSALARTQGASSGSLGFFFRCTQNSTYSLGLVSCASNIEHRSQLADPNCQILPHHGPHTVVCCSPRRPRCPALPFPSHFADDQNSSQLRRILSPQAKIPPAGSPICERFGKGDTI